MMKKVDEASAVTWQEDVAPHIVKLAVEMMEEAAAQARASRAREAAIRGRVPLRTPPPRREGASRALARHAADVSR